MYRMGNKICLKFRIFFFFGGGGVVLEIPDIFFFFGGGERPEPTYREKMRVTSPPRAVA